VDPADRADPAGRVDPRGRADPADPGGWAAPARDSQLKLGK
jgi:hypothetical protein